MDTANILSYLLAQQLGSLSVQNKGNQVKEVSRDILPQWSTASSANTLHVMQDTDLLHSALRVFQSLSQPGSQHFSLVPTSATVHYAFQIVIIARQLLQSSQPQFDLGFVPLVQNDSSDALSLLVYRMPAQAVPLEDGQALRIESHQNPVLNGVAITEVLQSTSLQLFFTQESALTALQSLSIARLNLLSNSHDAVIIPDIIQLNDKSSETEVFYHFRLVLSNNTHILAQPSESQAFSDAITFLRLNHAKPAVKHPALPVPLQGAAASVLQQELISAAFSSSGANIHKSHARKADYVIVTEDTAIKNAAGAVAKVLSRVSSSGQCCPVYTEKKTEAYTGVISVAVKAIAVARGYIFNEGTGHEVAFQPYYHRLSQDAGALDVEQYMSEKQLLDTLNKQGSPAVIKSINNVGAYADDGISREGMEMAYDVFKVPCFPDAPEGSGLPVKVTAHSRHSVVSNIITKLVTEHKHAVLITAGGKAMHVAMTAVVSARSRLVAQGYDILLLPKFVTVDTTSTLGWESVFLRFNIVRCNPALTQNIQSVGASPCRFIINPLPS